MGTWENSGLKIKIKREIDKVGKRNSHGEKEGAILNYSVEIL